MPKSGKKKELAVHSDGSGSDVSEDEEDISWIQWFCSLKGNECAFICPPGWLRPSSPSVPCPLYTTAFDGWPLSPSGYPVVLSAPSRATSALPASFPEAACTLHSLSAPLTVLWELATLPLAAPPPWPLWFCSLKGNECAARLVP